MGYSEVSGPGANTNIVATGGINALGIVGAYERVFFAEEGQKFTSVAAAKLQANWDTDAVAGLLTYLGRCRFEDTSEEAQFYTDAPLNINEETSPPTKVLRAIQQVNAVVHAELLKMDGKSGRVYVQTTNSYLIGRIENDGEVIGRQCTIAVTQRTLPSSEQPVEYTQIDITFTDNKGDELNPMEAKIDWLFSEVEQVYPITGITSNVSSNGSQLDFDIALTKAGSNEPLTGALQADFSITDENGNALDTFAGFSETNGVYSIQLTTSVTAAYVRFDGRRTIGGSTYYLDTVLAQV